MKGYDLVRGSNTGGSERVRRDGELFVHLEVKRHHTGREPYYDPLAVDLGARWITGAVALSDRDIPFDGTEVRRSYGHYKLRRKCIGQAKVEKGRQVIERIGDTESLKVDDRLHKIGSGILAKAADRNALIVLWDLDCNRDGYAQGRHTNDKIHRFPFAKLRTFVDY